VDVRLSPEHIALRDSVAQAVDRLGPHAVPDLYDEERQAKLDAAVVASGWRELRTANEGGEPWASAVEVALVAEELGRGLADTAFLGPTLGADLRRLAGAPSAAGRETVVLATDLSGPPAPDTPSGVALDAAGATSALVLQGDQVRQLALGDVVAGSDLTRPAAGVSLAASSTLDGPADRLSFADVTRWQSLGLAVTCADLVGVMRGAVDLATEYARSRSQYGARIGSFQAVQHMLADALVMTEGSRSIALHAAWAVDALPSAEALAAAAAAKAYCARAGRSVCETAIQVHGGIGNTWECLAHVFLRRALLSTEVFGGIGTNLARVLAAQGIGDHDGFR